MVAIETEVKSMEKRVSKIKTILLSKEIFDFSPEEHLKHGEVSVDYYLRYVLIMFIFRYVIICNKKYFVLLDKVRKEICLAINIMF